MFIEINPFTKIFLKRAKFETTSRLIEGKTLLFYLREESNEIDTIVIPEQVKNPPSS